MPRDDLVPHTIQMSAGIECLGQTRSYTPDRWGHMVWLGRGTPTLATISMVWGAAPARATSTDVVRKSRKAPSRCALACPSVGSCPVILATGQVSTGWHLRSALAAGVFRASGCATGLWTLLQAKSYREIESYIQ